MRKWMVAAIGAVVMLAVACESTDRPGNAATYAMIKRETSCAELVDLGGIVLDRIRVFPTSPDRPADESYFRAILARADALGCP